MIESDSTTSKPVIEHLRNKAGGEGAVVLNTSIGAQEFQLVYNAREEPLGGSRSHIAKNIVSFCKLHDCGYVIIADGNCWISADKGISLLAQIEDNEELDQYDMVVMPLDTAVYIAEINEGLVISERVSPADQAIESLHEEKNRRLAILNGGTTTEQLQQQGLTVNCNQQLFVSGDDAKPYSFQNLIWALIKNRFYHHKLLAPLGLALAILVFIGHFFITLIEKVEDIEVFAEEAKPSISEIISIATQSPPNYLNDSASQQFQQISPWITGTTVDFLKTCRLKKIDIKNGVIHFSGQRMSSTDKGNVGCGNQRLKKAIQDNQLDLLLKNHNWSFSVHLDPIIKQPRERTVYIDTMEYLELLAKHLNWQMKIRSTQSKGKNQKITIVLNTDQINTQTLSLLTASFSGIAAQLTNASLTFKPESLQLVDARFELSIYTQSGRAS